MSTQRRWLVLTAMSLLLLATATAALAAGADTITVRERQIDVNPGELNPCTGATGTLVDDEQDVFHITALADGTLHLTGHSTVAITSHPTIRHRSLTKGTRHSRSARTPTAETSSRPQRRTYA